MPVCKSCGADIEWVTTRKGTLMPLNPGPTPEGNLVVDDGVARMRVEGEELEPREAHFVSCPQSREWRR